MKKIVYALSLIVCLSVMVFGCAPHAKLAQIDGDLFQYNTSYIFGEAENVTVLPENITFKARMDTGATTTSINAVDVTTFERDGKEWVRFNMIHPETEKKISFERRVTRTVNIKRHGAEDQLRKAVKLHLRMGPVEDEIEVTLADRTKFEYPALIGRNFMTGTMVIDVSRAYVSGESMGE